MLQLCCVVNTEKLQLHGPKEIMFNFLAFLTVWGVVLSFSYFSGVVCHMFMQEHERTVVYDML